MHAAPEKRAAPAAKSQAQPTGHSNGKPEEHRPH
jgi:hypothetical protein